LALYNTHITYSNARIRAVGCSVRIILHINYKCMAGRWGKGCNDQKCLKKDRYRTMNMMRNKISYRHLRIYYKYIPVYINESEISVFTKDKVLFLNYSTAYKSYPFKEGITFRNCIHCYSVSCHHVFSSLAKM
jgi:hypothetical protein